MNKLPVIILMLFSLISKGQDNWFEKQEAIADSICETELQLKFDLEIGKFGYTDSTENYIIKPEFYCATEFIHCLALVSKKKSCESADGLEKSEWHYIIKTNEMVFPPRMEERRKWESQVKTAN